MPWDVVLWLRVARAVGDRHFHLLAQPSQHRHESVDGEATEIGAADAAEVGGGKTGQLLGAADGQLLLVQGLDDAGGQDRAELFQLGVGKAEVAEGVAAAAH